jgi:hypothetical protein
MALVSTLMVHARAGREEAAGFAQGRCVNHCNASVETFVPAQLIEQRRRPANPVGHRQPRASDVPSEKNLSDPNDPLSKENALLDKKIKSVCRGC